MTQDSTMSNLPILYKKTSTGAIQTWKISTRGCEIITTYGQLDGKIQETVDLIREGKNQGRSNETSAEQQAKLEAEARHTKQLKKGYVSSKAGAAEGKTDKLIEGGALPMLAKSYDEHANKISWPACVQPKLDGHRCVAVIDKAGKVTLWSRTRKPISSVPHIVAALERLKLRDIVLDGELYNHELKADFERLTSLIRHEVPHPDSKVVQYHIYDCMADEIFGERSRLINQLISGKAPALVCVETVEVADETELFAQHEKFVERGYEGAIVRNIESMYEGKRTCNLQKVKKFQDAEFPIIRLEEGRGKLRGHVGAVICSLSNGKEFGAKMAGQTQTLREAWERPQLWLGKLLTVKFQGLTSDEVPRFPVGLRIRQDL